MNFWKWLLGWVGMNNEERLRRRPLARPAVELTFRHEHEMEGLDA